MQSIDTSLPRLQKKEKKSVPYPAQKGMSIFSGRFVNEKEMLLASFYSWKESFARNFYLRKKFSMSEVSA